MICRFVWRKKIERDVTQGVPLDMFSAKAEKIKQKERMVRIILVQYYFSASYMLCQLVGTSVFRTSNEGSVYGFSYVGKGNCFSLVVLEVLEDIN